MSAFRPPRCSMSLMMPGRVSSCRWLQGSQISTPRHSTSPTRNRLPIRSFSRTPRTTTWRRDWAPVRPTSSRTSASISVSALPGAGLSMKWRSPTSPLPATAVTDSTGARASLGPMLIASTCMVLMISGFGTARQTGFPRPGMIGCMTVVKINAITVPTDSGDELARRFAARAGAVDNQGGFEGFELLKPTDERTTWLVVTRWRDEESFQAWMRSPAFGHGHRSAAERAGGQAPPPVGINSELWSYEVAGGSSRAARLTGGAEPPQQRALDARA